MCCACLPCLQRCPELGGAMWPSQQALPAQPLLPLALPPAVADAASAGQVRLVTEGGLLDVGVCLEPLRLRHALC